MNTSNGKQGGAWQLHSDDETYPILKQDKMNHWSKYNDELEKAEKKYNGKYNKWTGVLKDIVVWSRQDISHAVMRLSGYNAAPSLPCWKALYHTIRYLFYKPHVPIMYPR